MLGFMLTTLLFISLAFTGSGSTSPLRAELYETHLSAPVGSLLPASEPCFESATHRSDQPLCVGRAQFSGLHQLEHLAQLGLGDDPFR